MTNPCILQLNSVTYPAINLSLKRWVQVGILLAYHRLPLYSRRKNVWTQLAPGFVNEPGSATFSLSAAPPFRYITVSHERLTMSSQNGIDTVARCELDHGSDCSK